MLGAPSNFYGCVAACADLRIPQNVATYDFNFVIAQITHLYFYLP